jgi:hypothetical protein
MTRLGHIVLLVAVVTAAVCAVASEYSIAKIRSSAEAAAGENPYCLQVSGNGDYREVRSLYDLSIFRMRSSSGTYHAVLVIQSGSDSKLLHWSYWNLDFRDGAIGSPALYCTPEPHSLAALTRSPRREPEAITFRVEGMTFKVPRAFRPVALDGPYRGMTFFATPPRFDPLEKPPQYDKPVDGETILQHIEVNFGQTDRPQVWSRRDDRYYKTQEVGEEAGLNKRLVWYLDPATKVPRDGRPSIDYFEQASDGRIRTSIKCPAGEKGSCLHAFSMNGWTYTFHHTPAAVGNWRAMQERLSSLTTSFVISGKLVSIKP